MSGEELTIVESEDLDVLERTGDGWVKVRTASSAEVYLTARYSVKPQICGEILNRALHDSPMSSIGWPRMLD